nr:MAG TPA: hypothetical protein [Caudoviricetes sp.]
MLENPVYMRVFEYFDMCEYLQILAYKCLF